MANIDSILKSRDVTLLTKVCLIKAMVFQVFMYGCENCTIKKAEYRRIDAFELWYWRKFLRVLWPARRSNQSFLKEISPEYSLEGWCWNWSSNTLSTWWEELTHKKFCCWKRLRAGEGDDKGWWHHRLSGITGWMDMSLSKIQELVMDREALLTAVCGVTKSWTWQSNWKDLLTGWPSGFP